MQDEAFDRLDRHFQVTKRQGSGTAVPAALLAKVVRGDPFDPRLRTHKINRLSAAWGRTVYAVEVEGDLRVVFCLDGNTVFTLDIGTHASYER